MKPQCFSLGDLETSLWSAAQSLRVRFYIYYFFSVNKAIYFFPLKFRSPLFQLVTVFVNIFLKVANTTLVIDFIE